MYFIHGISERQRDINECERVREETWQPNRLRATESWQPYYVKVRDTWSEMEEEMGCQLVRGTRGW